MNEITRIHIAKVAYDIDITAKKQLEKYIHSLEAYTGDSEVLSDIEIRMTELLLERKVSPGGVITADDVKAIRAQLGEPYEFADEDGDIAVGVVDEDYSRRKLFRDTQHAVLGGVLSGIATYFKIDALWVRLIFVVLLFISFGLVVFAYVLLWIVVPPARTATDKLRQEGRPVTLASLRQASELEGTTAPNQVAPVVKRLLTITAGLISLAGALATFSIIVFGVIAVLGHNDSSRWFGNMTGGNAMTLSGWVVGWIVLAGLLLLTALFSLIAYALFAQKFTKRIWVSGVIIIVLGVTSLAAVVGITASESWRLRNELQQLVKQSKVNLPSEFASVTSVVFDIPSGNEYGPAPSVLYVVDQGTPRYELLGLPGTKPKVTIDGTTAKITLTIPKDYRNSFIQPRLTIYGPALTSFTAESGSISYTPVAQPSLETVTKPGTSVSINGGSIVTLKASGSDSSVDFSSMSVTTLVVAAEHGMSVSAGTVRELILTLPDVCPSGSSRSTQVSVAGVTSGKVMYNGTERAVATYRTNCAELLIGDDQSDLYE